MGSNLQPDYGIKTSAKRDICLTSEAIANPTSTGGIPLGDERRKRSREECPTVDDTNKDNADHPKSREQFFENLIIDRAPAEVRNKNKPTASSTPEEIAAWRERVLNHKETRHRFIFQDWPRDPNGQPIKPENSKLGKMAGNNEQIWGATLLDFYMVQRIPSVPNYVTFSSGSKLARWMKEQGETEAQDMIERQEDEPDPYQIFPCDIARLITDGDLLQRGKSWTKIDTKGKAKEKEPWELPELWPPPSPFHPSAYPHLWPREPFANDFRIRIPTLQQYIMQSLLPKKLVVHDPWRLLNVGVNTEEKESQRQKRIPWHKKRDITHVYNLQHSTRNRKRKEQDDAEAKATEEKRRNVRDTFLADPHSKHELPGGYLISPGQDREGPCAPPIFVVLPFLPNPQQPEEAHLYIEPASKIGEGHHSFVYKAELELPRNLLIDEMVCHKCVFEDLEAILREQDGENGEHRDPKWNVKSGKYVLKTIRKPTMVTTMPNRETGEEEEYILKEGVFSRTLEYEGPFRAIESRVQYQDLSKAPYCKHLREDLIHPLTAKVSVAAKLSIGGDAHLAREAENYQAFPRHFFEHWSGYNLIHPLHEPVPVGPVVPQFYGYYVVDEFEERRLREEREAARQKRREDRERKAKEKEAMLAKDEKLDAHQEVTKGQKEGQDASVMAVDRNEEDEPSGSGHEKSQIMDSREAKAAEEEASAMAVDQDQQAEGVADSQNADSDGVNMEGFEDENEEMPESAYGNYLSPILLLENCGTPIDPDDLSVDDKSESGSLVYRFHEEGWIHGSIAKRNILRQPGPLSAWPIERMVNASERGGYGKDWSFRLIDFGRSYKLEESELNQGRPCNAMIKEGSVVTGWVQGWGDELH